MQKSLHVSFLKLYERSQLVVDVVIHILYQSDSTKLDKNH